jgi:CubicO group peptidase (beta-lactamase class C family)
MTHDTNLNAAIDSLVEETYHPTQPGAAMIVIKAGQVLYRSAIGLAQMELGVPITPEMGFRLGSITKQFTAVAILRLVEQGRLALTDPITTFLPEYPTHGHTITIEHLLTHTSGIRSYTSMPEWQAIWRKDFTVAELIDFFKYQPMEFAPGIRWSYNNSGYHLLGAIIEQVSGQSYEQFLQQQIFEPLGMLHTANDNTRRIIPLRVAGYSKEGDEYVNAEYLSMTQPYAAGGLLSTVDDLAIWNAALTNNTLLAPDLLQRAWQPYTLADGSSTGYGYGWAIDAWQGRPTIEHGGGIHGFVTYGLRMPEDDLFIAILSNNESIRQVELLALKIAGLVIGAPYVPPVAISLEAQELEALVGTYQLPHKQQWVITLEDGQLIGQRTDWPRISLIPVANTAFYVEAMPLLRLIFTPNSTLEVHGRSGIEETALRADT